MDYKEVRELVMRFLVLQDEISKATDEYWKAVHAAPDKRVIASEEDYKQFLMDKEAYQLLLKQKEFHLNTLKVEERTVENNLQGFFIRSAHAHLQIRVIVDGDTYDLGCYAGTKEIYYNKVNE